MCGQFIMRDSGEWLWMTEPLAALVYLIIRPCCIIVAYYMLFLVYYIHSINSVLVFS